LQTSAEGLPFVGKKKMRSKSFSPGKGRGVKRGEKTSTALTWWGIRGESRRFAKKSRPKERAPLCLWRKWKRTHFAPEFLKRRAETGEFCNGPEKGPEKAI